MIRLTDKQKQAVFTRDCDILVSAAAGSGKTAVLSERILQQLMDVEHPSNITDFLIVTFTNAAAAEMKDRIGKKIMEASADDSLDAELKKHLRKQLSLIGKASITTIHAFCLDIIRNNFHFLGIDPAVRVADANESELIKLQAANEMLEKMYAEDGQLFSELCKWIGSGNDEKLIAKILSIYRFLSGFPNPLLWLEEKVEEYNPEKNCDFYDNKWIEKLIKNGKNRVESLIVSAENLCKQAVKFGIFTYEEALLNDILVLKEYLKCFETGIDALICKEIEFDAVRSGKHGFDKDLVESLSKKRKKIKDKAADICSCFSFTYDNFSEQFEKVYPRLKCLEKSICVFDQIFREKKKNSAIIDFSDFEHLALEVLSASENGVAESLKDKYREIMIDEYQDCNQTQELIFSYINRKVDGKSSNMFMVGDIKQSIYRFRLADPDIFAEKNQNYKPDGLQRKIILNNNFRSSATILDGVNAVFEKIMSRGLGGVDYSDEEKLFFRSNEIDKSKDEKCELVVLRKEDICDASEADYVAERIVELVNSGMKFSDISILIRQKSKSKEIEKALKSRNIPYFSDSGGGYFESLEIGLLTTMLKVIDNPMQDIELAAVLRSPIFDFDESLLAEIRLEKKGPFYGALLKYSSGEGEKAEKCRDFLNRLAIWRDKVLFTPVDEFLEYLIEDTGLDIFAASLNGGEQRSANLKLFVLQARLLQNSGFKGLFSFVSYMDRISAGGESGEAKMLSENSNVVRILTIHKSKGLEFPVVFLYGCDAAFNKADVQSEIILHKTEGIGIKYSDTIRKIKYPLISFDVVKNALLKDNLSEEMRVLYVALTRAKEKLICTATLKNADMALENAQKIGLDETSNYFEWIAKAYNDENWEMKIISAENIKNSGFENTESFVKLPDNIDFSTVKEIFEYRYPFEKATLLPTKLSVSEVKRRQEYESPAETKLYIPEISKFPAFLSDEKITAADKGIINHLVLKHIDILRPDVESCVDNLVDKGLLSEREKEFVEKDSIIYFFKSELGQRLINAEIIYRELPFEIALPANDLFRTQGFSDEKVILQGIIDLVFVENGETVVVDYKTDKWLSPNSMEMYKTQLDLYAVAVERILNKNISKKYLYMLSKQEVVEM